MITQKQAVTNAVLSLFPKFKLGGEVVLKTLLDTENKKEMKSIIFEGFRAKEITYAGKEENLADDAYLNKYVAGLLDNWVRKNPEFNAGGIYRTKNPGSRAGSGDESIREMRKLLKTVTDETEKTEIQTAIAARLAEIKPESVVTVNAKAIPEHLRKFIKS